MNFILTNEARAGTVAVLSDWAEWCDQHPGRSWSERKWPLFYGWHAHFAAYDWCSCGNGPQLRGRHAALALCFAAAMIESGDTSRGER